MADFNWYLSRQGIRGLTGAKGDQGYSPTIEEGKNTSEEYTLIINNEFESFETPNLRGDFTITDNGGKYVMYNSVDHTLEANDPIKATDTNYGVVRLATTEDLDTGSDEDRIAIGAKVLRDALPRYIVSPDNSVIIQQNPESELTELKVDTSGTEHDISELKTRVSGVEGRVDKVENDVLYLENTTQSLIQKDTLLENTIIGLREDLRTEAQIREAANIQQQGQIDAERQERETQDASLQTQLNSKLTADNIKAGSNVTITRDGNNVTINSTGGGGGTTYTAGDGINISGDVISTKVDNQTIKIQDGVMHADLSEIGDELNALAGRVNTLEGEVVVATDDRIGMVKPDGTTITINSDGVISSTGGSIPEVDNVTIEINEEGKLQTTVDINELQSKVEDLQLYKFPNATIIGTPTINNGQISGFSTDNYLQFPFEFETKGRTWLLNGSFDTKSDVTTQQNIIDSLASIALAVRNSRLVLALSTNGVNFDLGEHLSMSDIEPNTKYYLRLSFSGTQYLLSISTDKQEWLPEIIVTSDQPIASRPMTISSSGHPFGGTINLNDWDLTVANTLVWQGMDDVGIASRMDVNASNITETGINNLKEALGLANIETILNEILGDQDSILSLVDMINTSYTSDTVSTAAAMPMMLSLEPTELDVENSFSSNKSKAVFSEDLILPKNSAESYEDDTDVDLGGNA